MNMIIGYYDTTQVVGNYYGLSAQKFKQVKQLIYVQCKYGLNHH